VNKEGSNNMSLIDMGALAFVGFGVAWRLALDWANGKRAFVKTLGGMAVGAGLVAILFYGRFWGLVLLTVAGFVFLDFRQYQINEKAKAFRNEVRHRLDEIQNVPELLRSEMER
jgi:hypothetical protein